MREVTPTRSTAIELADERKLMRQGYEFLDEKRMLLATEILRQLKIYQQRSDELVGAKNFTRSRRRWHCLYLSAAGFLDW